MLKLRWTKTEVEQLRTLYSFLTNREVATRIGRTEESVKKKAFNLGLEKEYMRYNFWSESDIEILRQEYPIKSTREVAKILGRTETSVELKARRLQLRKDITCRRGPTHIGVIGEKLAMKFLINNGWNIIETGRSRGPEGCTPYDIIAEKDRRRFAINVKNMSNRLGSFAITARNLENLLKMDMEKAFLILTKENKFVFMPIILLNNHLGTTAKKGSGDISTVA